MPAHVAVQRILKSRGSKRKFMGRMQFIEFARRQKDSQKTSIRKMITCLSIFGFVSKDYKLIYALRTKKEAKEAKCRGKARPIARRVCKLKIRKNQVLHHKDENSCNNTCKNFEIIGAVEHRKIHRKKKEEKKCEIFLQEVLPVLLKN